MVDTNVRCSKNIPPTHEALIKVIRQMQATLRAIGSQHMNPDQHSMFVKTFNDGKLVKPEDCGHVIAALSLGAPKSLSGHFVSWDSDECKEFRRAE